MSEVKSIRKPVSGLARSNRFSHQANCSIAMSAMLDAYTTPAGKRAASLSSARDLSSLIFSEAGAAKEQGFVTDPVTDALRQTRLFWMMLPVEVGGGDMLAALDAIRGRPDASLDMQLRAHVNGGPSRLRGERATVRRDPARNGGLS